MPSFVRRLSRHAAFILLSASCVAAWAAPTLVVEETTTVAAAPAEVWKVIGDFGALEKWVPAIATTEISKGQDNVRGAERTLTTHDGVKIVEELLAYDGKGHSMRYRIMASPLPVKDYAATLAVVPEGKGSRIVWKSRFHRAGEGADADAKAVIAGIFRAGLDGARAKLGEGAKD